MSDKDRQAACIKSKAWVYAAPSLTAVNMTSIIRAINNEGFGY